MKNLTFCFLALLPFILARLARLGNLAYQGTGSVNFVLQSTIKFFKTGATTL